MIAAWPTAHFIRGTETEGTRYGFGSLPIGFAGRIWFLTPVTARSSDAKFRSWDAR